jgi:hypothetical protein
MLKIVNEISEKNEDAKTLQYFFDGNEWVQKWEQKFTASVVVIENNVQELEEVRQQVISGVLSPLAYYIHKNSFTHGILSSYTGISKRNIKKHLNPNKFNKLKDEILKKYAIVFEISVEELKNNKL